MMHIQAGIVVAAIWLAIIFISVALVHFVGAAGAGIILITTLVVGVGAVVVDYMTEEE
jgi:hypothetical protein